MRLTISNSEWGVLIRQMINHGVNPDNANQVINQHKEILNQFKEKLEDAKRTEIEKFTKKLDKLSVKDKKNKILKFENQKEEELSKKFREKFYKIAQDIEGKY